MKLETSATEPIRSYLKNFIEKYQISKRESDVIVSIINEHSNIKDIAQQLELSPSTVNNHLNNIYEKTQTSSKAELVSKILSDVVMQFKNCNILRRTPRLLIIDDEQELCDNLSTVLELRGFKTYKSSDPKRAIEMVYELDLDFIVTDIRMPQHDGFDVMNIVRKSHRYSPQIIFITGFSNYSLAEALDLGAVTILTKPIDHEKLISVILENYIESHYERERFFDLKKKFLAFSNETIPVDDCQLGFGGIFVPASYKKNRQVPNVSGTRVELKLALPGKKEINTICELVWSREKGDNDFVPGYAFKFINISENDYEEVRNLVREKKITSYIPLGRSNNLRVQQ